MRAIRIIVTGGIGCGKSTLCRELAHAARTRRLTVDIIEVDMLRAQMLEDTLVPRYRRLQEEIAVRFGPRVRNASGGIDRHMLSQIAFRSRQEINTLDAILDPALKLEIERELKGKDGLVLIDYALAAEKNLLDLSDYNSLLVVCQRSTQLRRLVSGDLPPWQIRARMMNQFSNLEKERCICNAQKAAGKGLFLRIWNEDALSEARCRQLLDSILAAHHEKGADYENT